MATSKAGAIGAGCFGLIVLEAISVAIGGWVLMLLCGALWHSFGWLQPIGYWTACGLAFLISVVLTFVGGVFRGR